MKESKSTKWSPKGWSTREYNSEELEEWDVEKTDQLIQDIERYIPVDCEVTKEFFRLGVMFALLDTSLDSKKWERRYREAVNYMINPDMVGVRELLDFAKQGDQETYEGYHQALTDQGFMEAISESRREDQRKKDLRRHYAINAAKLKQSMEVE